MNKKETTTDDLARMVQKGFENTATKSDVSELRSDMPEVNLRLDRIENPLLRAHENRIERLEDKMRIVETAMEVSA